MSKVSIEDDGYTYSTPDLRWNNQPVGYMPALIAAAEKFLELDKVLEAIPDEGLTQYHTNVNVAQIVLEIEGDPWGVIMFLDDTVQFVPFEQHRTEESK